jgi:hypothetical protein
MVKYRYIKIQNNGYKIYTHILYFIDSKMKFFHILKLLKLWCILDLMASKNRC